jgi:DNA repair photolyase
MEAILAASAEAGASSAGYVLLRLPMEVRGLFERWLHDHYPLKAEHVMSAVRATRGGRDYDARFGSRMKGEGTYAQLLAQRFRLACGRFGLNRAHAELDLSVFQPPREADGQLDLF